MSSVQARRQHKALVAVHQAAIIDFIASFADQALRVELMLTSKPGLVDRRNNGAHHDMDLQILLTSARANCAVVAALRPDRLYVGFHACRLISCQSSVPPVFYASSQCSPQRVALTHIKARPSR
jgi:hypothetical protein